jgi:hypothetical protein
VKEPFSIAVLSSFAVSGFPSVVESIHNYSLEGGIPAEQKREKKDTKKGTTSESRCVIILSSKLGHSPRALFSELQMLQNSAFCRLKKQERR